MLHCDTLTNTCFSISLSKKYNRIKAEDMVKSEVYCATVSKVGLRFKGHGAVSAPSGLSKEEEEAVQGLHIQKLGDCAKAIAIGKVCTEERRAFHFPLNVCMRVCCIVI